MSGSPAPATSAPLRLGTRRSALATTQSRHVADLVAAGGSAVDLVLVTTHGDVSTAPLATIGGTGVFVSALRDALVAGTVELAVHSLKDLPTAPPDGLVVAAVPPREDPRDVLVAAGGRTLAELPAGARVGTGSPRRRALLLDARPDLDVVAVRGNVDTRLAMVHDGALDAVVLAAAGLRRLDRLGEASELLDPATFVPAPGQGALAVECRADDEAVLAVLRGLDDPRTRVAVTAERTLLAALEAGCSAPVGAFARVLDGEPARLELRAAVASPDGTLLRETAVADLPAASAEEAAAALGRDLAARLLPHLTGPAAPSAPRPADDLSSQGSAPGSLPGPDRPRAQSDRESGS
ncbi:hydroxymethylbilane synthase [Kineococcus xinjiangensis]|uniref:Porphobilinogen deaminase n=1 Tax=Kineococcus xinjiangensis TaxID=512762 RepID=A0A2S6IH29_9ACTN|nr:hydroxymethylbilane synthase [Kineococcus xinjiangensis]PPK93501.1 hydroxymethylbilane synthase [Kineococcus xinjiangensis]